MAKLVFGTILGAAFGWIVGYLDVMDRMTEAQQTAWTIGLIPFRVFAFAPDVVLSTAVGAVIGFLAVGLVLALKSIR